jgi:hypothetical protein
VEATLWILFLLKQGHLNPWLTPDAEAPFMSITISLKQEKKNYLPPLPCMSA